MLTPTKRPGLKQAKPYVVHLYAAVIRYQAVLNKRQICYLSDIRLKMLYFQVGSKIPVKSPARERQVSVLLRHTRTYG